MIVSRAGEVEWNILELFDAVSRISTNTEIPLAFT